MIIVDILEDGRTYTRSDSGFKIMREDGVIYDDAVDSIQHNYTETNILIVSDTEIDDPESREMLVD